MTRQRRLVAALALNVVIVVTQVVFGLLAHSVGLLADAGHNLSDVAAVCFSLIAVRLAARPATAQRSFGYHRATILAAQANAALLLMAIVLVAFEAVRRLVDPQPVESGLVIVVAVVAVLGNTIATLIVYPAHAADLNMRSVMLHLASDAAVSVGVLVAGIGMAVSEGAFWLDPAVSILIAVVIGWRAIKLLVETADVLLESTPAGLDTVELEAAIVAVPGVESVHDLHVWSLSSDFRALAAHIVIEGNPSLEEAQAVGQRVRDALAEHWAIAHSTLELECESCEDDDRGTSCASTALDHAEIAGHMPLRHREHRH
ncbi:MAG: cation diffusion facilitator family transporter [Acidimicrobiales bacterium]|nr:cation diffusion facilitator family transporter [Acidimicrobiales bacterium]